MKKNCFVFGMVFLTFFLFASLAFGQNIQTYQIPLRSGAVELQKGRFDTSGGRYVIVQFERTLKRDQIEALRSLGISPLTLIYRGAWLCSVAPGAMSEDVRERFAITASAPWAAEYRISPQLLKGEFQEWARTADGRIKLLVTFFEDVSQPEMEQVLGKYDPRFAISKAPVTWAIRLAPSLIASLISEPGIFWIEEGPKPFQPLNDRSRVILRVDPVQNVDLVPTPPVYYGLSGHGVNIAVSESVDTDHPDFWDHDATGNPTVSRFLNTGGGGFHGTHVAGIIGGNGWNSDREGNTGVPYQWRGMAPEATLISEYGYDSFPVDASNHSYVMDYGEYGTTSRNVDRDIRRGNGFDRRRSHIWAAANQGGSAQYDNEEGYYSIYSPAKNAICVGAAHSNDGSLADFSSLGPTFDGRIKPDVMAPGAGFAGILTVSIDYIRILDGSNKVIRSWEFNTDGDAEGWFKQGLDNYKIGNVTVSGGLMSYQAAVGSYGFCDPENVEAKSDHVAKVRYKIENPDLKFSPKFAVLFWSLLGGDYVDGNIEFDVVADNQFHEVTIPVGQSGRELAGPPGFEDIGPNGWKGTIDKLRLDFLVAKAVVSTSNDGHYIDAQGTSMAAPAVTGVVALMLQQFVEKGKWVDEDWEAVDLDVNPPLPSTIKGVLIQTARDLVHTVADPIQDKNPDTGAPVLYYEGPDFATGYGLVNAQAAVELIAAAAANRHIHEAYMLDGTHEYEFTLSSPPPSEIKITLAWDDVEGSTVLKQTVPRLVNDLDLVLIDPQGNRHYPWTLDPLPVADCGGAGPGCGDLDPINPGDVKPAYRAPDHRNNVEQVHVASPQAGLWKVQVEGDGIQDVTDGRQSYSLVSSVPLVRKFTDPTKPIIPIIEYVNEVDGTYTVYFGYKNPNSYVVVVEVGDENNVDYAGQGVLPDQITMFQPGRNIGVFSMNFDGSDLKWTLNGTTISTKDSEVKQLRITPILNRVVNHCDGVYTAYFGYESPHPFTVTKEMGDLNKLESAGSMYSYDPQITEFQPGRFSEVFSVDFDGQDLTWTLDGVDAVANASMASNVCPPFQFFKAFAFGADSFTRTVPNAPHARYIKIVQNGANFLYDPSRGYGYVNTRMIDDTPNNRGILSGDDEIYDQFIGVKTKIDQNYHYYSPEIVFRVDVPDGIYRFVAAGGDPQNSNHSTTIRVSTGQYGSQVTLLEGKKPAANTFFRVGFDDKRPPRGDGSGTQPNFQRMETSPYLRVPSDYGYYNEEESGPPGSYILVHQIAGMTDPGWAIGGDLCLLELWYIPDTPSVSGGEVQGSLARNAGIQTFEVTETGIWRKAERYYGLQGIDEIWPMRDGCGITRTFAVGWHQNDLAEYLMKFGGEYNRLILRGKAARPAPVVVDILIDGEVKGRTAWTAGNDCSQDISVVIPGVDYGTHAIAVRFVNDLYNPQQSIDRNLYLEALLVPEPADLPSVTHGLPKSQFCAWGRCYNAFQSDEVTPVNTWRSADRFYGHQGMDQIEPLTDGCGKSYTYAVGWHRNDLIEYLMKIGGQYSHLVLRGKADRPGPVDIEIWVDGELYTTAAWDGDNNATRDIDVQVYGIPYGTHAIAVKFARDEYTPGGDADRDLNLYLSALKVSKLGILKILSDDTWKSWNQYVEGWQGTNFADWEWRNAYAPYPNGPNGTPPSNWVCGTEAVYMWDYPYAKTPDGMDGPRDAWFRKTFYASADPWEIETAVITVGADDDFDLYVNGTKVLEDWNGVLWGAPYRKDIKPYLVSGQNVVAIHARDTYGIYEWLLVDGTVE